MKKIIFFIATNCMFAVFADRLAPVPEPKNIFYNLPILETERLILRPVRTEDALDLHNIYADPEVVKYLASELDKTIDDTKNGLNGAWKNTKWVNPLPGQLS